MVNSSYGPSDVMGDLVKKLTCVCGKLSLYFYEVNIDGHFYLSCDCCGLGSGVCPTKIDALISWIKIHKVQPQSSIEDLLLRVINTLEGHNETG